ncbi:unnamed protein product [Umbelopsis vinacea]
MGNTRSSLMRSKHSKRKTSSKVEVACNGSLPSSRTSGSRGTQSKVIEGREFHNEENSVYVLAMDDEEKDRLHEQHFLLKESYGNLLLHNRVAPIFDNEIHVLDVGCGPGSWVLDMATEYPHVTFYGTDISIYPKNCNFSIANVLEPCPFNRQFDFIQMRFFCVALRASEWDIAYQNMYKLLKPGGYFQVLEPSILMNTTDPDLQEVISAFTKLLEKKGQDYDIGPKIKGKLETVGYDMLYDLKQESPIGWGNTMNVRGAEDMRSLYRSIVPFLAAELNIDLETCRAKIERAVDAMGPTKTTINIWAFLGQKPLEESQH